MDTDALSDSETFVVKGGDLMRLREIAADMGMPLEDALSHAIWECDRED